MGALKKQLFVMYEDNNELTLYRNLVVDFQESNGYVQYSRVIFISVHFMNAKLEGLTKSYICRSPWEKSLGILSASL